MATFFLGALFLTATAVAPLVDVFLTAGFLVRVTLVVAAALGAALATVAFLGADLVAVAVTLVLVALAAGADLVFFPPANTFAQPSAYREFVPTRVIVTFQFS